MYDVAVVGGGPAACAAALTLRTGGVATIMICSSKSRDKPTETAVSQLKQLLKSLGALGALTACEPCYGIESSWGDLHPVFSPSIFDRSGHAWFIHRAQFDASLIRLVEAAGVVRQVADATSFNQADDGVILNTSAGPVVAKYLLIANGSPAWAARATGQKPLTIDSLVCYWARLAVPIESRLLHVESTESGWWYVCPGEAGTTFACFVTDLEGSRQFAPSKLTNWNALLRGTRLCRLQKLDACAGQIHCLTVGMAALSRRQGSRWIAAGDAATKLDPVGSSGTATALQSGVLAACVLLCGHQRNDAAEKYDRWMNGMMAEFLKRRPPLYAAEASKYPAGFWARRL